MHRRREKKRKERDRVLLPLLDRLQVLFEAISSGSSFHPSLPSYASFPVLQNGVKCDCDHGYLGKVEHNENDDVARHGGHGGRLIGKPSSSSSLQSQSSLMPSSSSSSVLREVVDNGIGQSVFQPDTKELQQFCSQSPFPWHLLPEDALPGAGDISGNRETRKREQIHSLLLHTLPLLEDNQTVVEFGGGTGHFIIFLAFITQKCYPESKFILVERKEFTATMAKKRIDRLNLADRVYVLNGSLEEFADLLKNSRKDDKEVSEYPSPTLIPSKEIENTEIDCSKTEQIREIENYLHNGTFQVGTALHACGYLTDLVVKLCARSKANFCLVPCCYGQNSIRDDIPRSHVFQKQHDRSDTYSVAEFKTLAACADYTVNALVEDYEILKEFQIAKKCMMGVDCDRLLWAQEMINKLHKGLTYSTRICSLAPLECSPKNNIIIATCTTVEENNSAATNLPDYIQFKPSSYAMMLAKKTERLQGIFTSLVDEKVLQRIHICSSSELHHRMRCRFQIVRSHGVEEPLLQYAMWENGQPSVRMTTFPLASEVICHLMPILLRKIAEIPVLCQGIAAMHFLSTTTEEVIVTLIYEAPILAEDETEISCRWRSAAIELQSYANEVCASDIYSSSRSITPNNKSLKRKRPSSCKGHPVVGIIGRSKGVKVCTGIDFVMEIFTMESGDRLVYKQVEGAFSNPNAEVNQKSLQWLSSVAQDIINDIGHSKHGEVNLLELYCGNGNHTMMLSTMFSHVFAVEIDARLVDAAWWNAEANSATNIHIIRVDSQKFASRILKKKSYTFPERGVRSSGEMNSSREVLKHDEASVEEGEHSISLQAGASPPLLSSPSSSSSSSSSPLPLPSSSSSSSPSPLLVSDDRNKNVVRTVDFHVVLVDPPRAGLDSSTLKLVSTYDHIIYISCNPDALQRDLRLLCKTHEVKRMALFDQFPFTEHTECGIYCRKIQS